MPDVLATIDPPCCWPARGQQHSDTCCLRTPATDRPGPRRIRFIRWAGAALPDGAKLITRPGRYGNPFTVKECGSQQRAVQRFRIFLSTRRQPPAGWINPYPSYPDDERIQFDLGGYDLACACRDGTPCHGDVLLTIANTPLEDTRGNA